MIKAIQHFSFTVSNLENAIHFFCNILGLKATPVEEHKGKVIEEVLQIPGVILHICFVTTPDNNNIELIQYLVPKGQKIDLKPCNTGVGHIAFLVDDIQKMYKDLVAKGVKFNNFPSQVASGARKGWSACYLKGPDDIPIEFISMPKDY